MTGRKRSKDLRRVLRIAEGGDAGTATLLLRRRVDADPSAAEPRACLAEVLLQSGDAPSALSEARTALGLDPSSESAAGVAAAAAVAIGRAGTVLDFGRELVAARPDEPDAYRALMRLSVGVGDLYEAALAAEWLVDHSNDAREAAAVLQDIARRAGLDGVDEAAEEVALAVAPDAPSAVGGPAGFDHVEESASAPDAAGTADVGLEDDVDELMPVELVPALPDAASGSSDPRGEEEPVPPEVPAVPPLPDVAVEVSAAAPPHEPVDGAVDGVTVHVPPIPSRGADDEAQELLSDDGAEPAALVPPVPAGEAVVVPSFESTTESHDGEQLTESDDSDGSPEDVRGDSEEDGERSRDASGASTIDDDAGASRVGDEPEEIDLRPLAASRDGTRTRRRVNAP